MRISRWFLPFGSVALLLFTTPLKAGEPLVVKTPAGKFIAAAASEWAKSGEHSFRFILKAGAKAPAVAAELKDKVSPISVRAPDDFTLVFESSDLTEPALLEKLAGIPLSGERATGDAMAALSNLGGGEGPALSDLSSAGSIRASKKIDLPGSGAKGNAANSKNDPANLTGIVVKVCDCGPMPSLVIKVLTPPRKGPNRNAFKRGDAVPIRGSYKLLENTQEIDREDPATQANLATRELKPGDKIFGQPLQKEGVDWVLETVQKM